MAIVTFSYYNCTYMGETIAEKDFPRIEKKAERIISQITHGRAANFAALPAFQQEAIRTAICAQCEYYALMGTDISINGDTGTGGWAIGDMRINGRGSSGTTAKQENIAATMICAAAIAALEQTGLMNPQVETRGDPVFTPWGWFV